MCIGIAVYILKRVSAHLSHWLIDWVLKKNIFVFLEDFNLNCYWAGEQHASGAGSEQEKALWLVGGGDGGREEVHGQDLAGGEEGEGEEGGEEVKEETKETA